MPEQPIQALLACDDTSGSYVNLFRGNSTDLGCRLQLAGPLYDGLSPELAQAARVLAQGLHDWLARNAEGTRLPRQCWLLLDLDGPAQGLNVETALRELAERFRKETARPDPETLESAVANRVAEVFPGLGPDRLKSLSKDALDGALRMLGMDVLQRFFKLEPPPPPPPKKGRPTLTVTENGPVFAEPGRPAPVPVPPAPEPQPDPLESLGTLELELQGPGLPGKGPDEQFRRLTGQAARHGLLLRLKQAKPGSTLADGSSSAQTVWCWLRGSQVLLRGPAQTDSATALEAWLAAPERPWMTGEALLSQLWRIRAAEPALLAGWDELGWGGRELKALHVELSRQGVLLPRWRDLLEHLPELAGSAPDPRPRKKELRRLARGLARKLQPPPVALTPDPSWSIRALAEMEDDRLSKTCRQQLRDWLGERAGSGRTALLVPHLLSQATRKALARRFPQVEVLADCQERDS